MTLLNRSIQIDTNMLQQTRRKQRQQQQQQRREHTSPLWQCPIEILVEIFKHLPISTVDRSRRVCRYFKVIIETNPSIWRNLDLSGHAVKDYSTCARFSGYACRKVSRLSVDNAESLKTVANMCNTNRSLCLGNFICDLLCIHHQDTLTFCYTQTFLAAAAATTS